MYVVLVQVQMPLIEANVKVESFVSCINKEDLFAYQIHPCKFLMVATTEEEIEYAKELADTVFDEQCTYKHIRQ